MATAVSLPQPAMVPGQKITDELIERTSPHAIDVVVGPVPPCFPLPSRRGKGRHLLAVVSLVLGAGVATRRRGCPAVD